MNMSKYMNAPVPHNGKAYVEMDAKTMELWVHCPYCGKRAFPVDKETRITNMFFKCKGSNCKNMFQVDV